MLRLARLPLLALVAGCHLVFPHAPTSSPPAHDALGDRPRPIEAAADGPRIERSSPDGTPDAARDAGRDAARESKLGDLKNPDLKKKPDAKLADLKKPDAPPVLGCGGIDCDSPGAFCSGAGTITVVAGVKEWSGTAQPIPGSQRSIPVGKTYRLNLCGLDLSKLAFTGTDPYLGDDGAYFGLAIAGGTSIEPPNGVWFSITSTCPGKKYCNAGAFTHDDGYRSHLFQTWYRGGSVQRFGDVMTHQYNAEKGVALNPAAYAGAERFDLRLEVTPQAGGLVKYSAWVKMQVSPAAIECPAAVWNPAVNLNATNAWVAIQNKNQSGVTSDTSTVAVNLASASILTWVMNGGSGTPNPAQTASWSSIAAELLP